MSEQSVRIFDTTCVTASRLGLLRCGHRASSPASSTNWAWTSSKPDSRLRHLPTRKPFAASPQKSVGRSSRAWPGAIARIWKRRHGRLPCCEGPHSYLHRDVRSSPAGEAPDEPGAVSGDCGGCSSLCAPTPTTCSFRRRTPRAAAEFLCRVVQAVIDAGATTINLPDTVGFSTPDDMREFFDHPVASAEGRRGRVQHALPR